MDRCACEAIRELSIPRKIKALEEDKKPYRRLLKQEGVNKVLERGHLSRRFIRAWF